MKRGDRERCQLWNPSKVDAMETSFAVRFARKIPLEQTKKYSIIQLLDLQCCMTLNIHSKNQYKS